MGATLSYYLSSDSQQKLYDYMDDYNSVVYTQHHEAISNKIENYKTNIQFRIDFIKSLVNVNELLIKFSLSKQKWNLGSSNCCLYIFSR